MLITKDGKIVTCTPIIKSQDKPKVRLLWNNLTFRNSKNYRIDGTIDFLRGEHQIVDKVMLPQTDFLYQEEINRHIDPRENQLTRYIRTFITRYPNLLALIQRISEGNVSDETELIKFLNCNNPVNQLKVLRQLVTSAKVLDSHLLETNPEFYNFTELVGLITLISEGEVGLDNLTLDETKKIKRIGTQNNAILDLAQFIFTERARQR